MATINRRSMAFQIPAATTLAAADDLDGAGTTLDVSGAARVIIAQIANGTAGTVGIDTIQVSHDGGSTWAADATLLASSASDTAGTIVANGILNAAGVEPTGAAVWKSGPHRGPTLMRCARKVADDANSVAWTTGAPSVVALVIGG